MWLMCRSKTYGDSGTISGLCESSSSSSAAKTVCAVVVDDGGIGSSGSGVSLGIADCKDVSYAIVVRTILTMMIAKSMHSRCNLVGGEPGIAWHD